MTSTIDTIHRLNIKLIGPKNCSICNKSNGLMKLPDEFQEFSKRKGFVSYFCSNCISVVNFLE